MEYYARSRWAEDAEDGAEEEWRSGGGSVVVVVVEGVVEEQEAAMLAMEGAGPCWNKTFCA